MSYLSKDGYINTPAFIELVRDIDKLAVAEGLKPLEIHFSKKAIVRDDHPSKAKLEASAFEKKRAQPIKMRKRPPTSGSAVRMMVLLRNYKGLDQFADYWKDYQLALKAIERHNTKAERVIASIKTVAAKKRDAANAAFDKNIDCFVNKVLPEDAEYIIGQSMMGKTVILRLPNGGYLSVGKSDKQKYDAAVAKSQEAAAPPKKTAKAAPAKKTAKAAQVKAPAKKVAAKPVAKAAVKKAVTKPVMKTRR